MTPEQIVEIVNDIDNLQAQTCFYFTYQGVSCMCALCPSHGVFLLASGAVNDRVFTPRGPFPSVEAARALATLLGGEGFYDV